MAGNVATIWQPAGNWYEDEGQHAEDGREKN